MATQKKTKQDPDTKFDLTLKEIEKAREFRKAHVQKRVAALKQVAECGECDYEPPARDELSSMVDG